MSKNPTDSEIKDRAKELLNDGVLISELPSMLQKEFSITGPRAWRIATIAVKELRRG